MLAEDGGGPAAVGGGPGVVGGTTGAVVVSSPRLRSWYKQKRVRRLPTVRK
jgi:hypothetical protein